MRGAAAAARRSARGSKLGVNESSAADDSSRRRRMLPRPGRRRPADPQRSAPTSTRQCGRGAMDPRAPAQPVSAQVPPRRGSSAGDAAGGVSAGAGVCSARVGVSAGAARRCSRRLGYVPAAHRRDPGSSTASRLSSAGGEPAVVHRQAPASACAAGAAAVGAVGVSAGVTRRSCLWRLRSSRSVALRRSIQQPGARLPPTLRRSESASISARSGTRSTLPARRRLMLPSNASGLARNSAIIVWLTTRREPGLAALAIRHSVSLRCTLYVPPGDAAISGVL